MNRFWRDFMDNLKTALFVFVSIFIVIATFLCLPLALGATGQFYPLFLVGVPVGIVMLCAWLALSKKVL